MKPLLKLDEALTPDGRRLILYRRDSTFHINVDNQQLMSSERFGSEEALAELGCRGLGAEGRVLIGGLGMGFTLRAALDRLPGSARVVVAEVFPQVVAWNRQYFAALAGCPLDDRRVKVEQQDVAELLDRARYESIMLDVDNGPDALTLDRNRRLYDVSGLRRIRGALSNDGRLAVWSAAEDRGFARRLRSAGFAVTVERVRAQGRRGARHVIFVARRLD
ncbi:MAG: hypothetical protein H6707_07450 [Deltaproteobacteria bacterium]|nr:hypothetical protein [Deltaproteobacteria bacterium]